MPATLGIPARLPNAQAEETGKSSLLRQRLIFSRVLVEFT